MDKIKIELNSQLFKQLMQLIYLGRWMASSHKDSTDMSMQDVDQQVLSCAKDAGLDDWVEFDSTTEKYLPSSQFEEDMEPVIQEYDDFTFWDELAWQMAERDFANKFDHAQILCMTAEEIFREKNAMADKYFDEFSTNGLENLKLSK